MSYEGVSMRRSILRAAVAVIVAVAASGCVAPPPPKKLHPSRFDLLQPGVTTMADAVEILGPWTSRSAMPYGATLLQWQGNDSTGYPYYRVRGVHLSVMFGADGRMVREAHRAVIGEY